MLILPKVLDEESSERDKGIDSNAPQADKVLLGD